MATDATGADGGVAGEPAMPGALVGGAGVAGEAAPVGVPGVAGTASPAGCGGGVAAGGGWGGSAAR